MDVIVPRPLTLVSSNVSIEVPLWQSDTTYTAGQRVYLDTVSPPAVYESLQSSNTNRNPADQKTYWGHVGAINRYKMLDNYVTSQTENISEIAVTIAASKVDRIALFKLRGESVRIVVRNGTVVVSDETISLRMDNPSRSWSDYFFNDTQYRSDLIRPLPGYYLGLEVDITITAATGTPAKVGHLILGRSREIGFTEWGPAAGLQDYSRKETNEFGETYLLERPYGKTLDLDVWIKTSPSGDEADRVHSLLASLRALPCIYNGNNGGTNRELLFAYGYFLSFSVVVNYPTVSHCSLEIEGMI